AAFATAFFLAGQLEHCDAAQPFAVGDKRSRVLAAGDQADTLARHAREGRWGADFEGRLRLYRFEAGDRFRRPGAFAFRRIDRHHLRPRWRTHFEDGVGDRPEADFGRAQFEHR